MDTLCGPHCLFVSIERLAEYLLERRKTFLIRTAGVEESETPQHTLAFGYAEFWIIKKIESELTHQNLRRTAIS